MLIRNILTLFGLLILASFLGDVLAILIGNIIAFSVRFVFTSLIFLFLALGDKFARGFVLELKKKKNKNLVNGFQFSCN